MQDHTDLCNDSIQAGNAIGLVGNTSGTNWLYSKDKKCYFVILKKNIKGLHLQYYPNF